MLNSFYLEHCSNRIIVVNFDKRKYNALDSNTAFTLYSTGIKILNDANEWTLIGKFSSVEEFKQNYPEYVI